MEMGKSSSEFSAAAQKLANATWFFAILGAIVWYAFGWPWSLIAFAFAALTASQSISSTLIAGRLQQRGPRPNSVGDAVAIVRAYANVMEHSAPSPGCVADASRLPFPKSAIKAAIVTALRATDDAGTKDALRAGYTGLASWQEGVGGVDQGIDALNLDRKQDPKVLAEIVLKQSEGFAKWAPIMQEDSDKLKRELVELGLWYTQPAA
jgi:hypothetical protein